MIRAGRYLLVGTFLGGSLGCPQGLDLWLEAGASEVRFAMARDRLFDRGPVSLQSVRVSPCDAPGDMMWAVEHRPVSTLMDRGNPSPLRAGIPLHVRAVSYGESLGSHYAVVSAAVPLRPGRCYVVVAQGEYRVGSTKFTLRPNGRARPW